MQLVLCRNYDANSKKAYLFFRPRAGTEKFKIDLHTPWSQRGIRRYMTALQAATAAMEFLKILHWHMGELQCLSFSQPTFQLQALCLAERIVYELFGSYIGPYMVHTLYMYIRVLLCAVQ